MFRHIRNYHLTIWGYRLFYLLILFAVLYCLKAWQMPKVAIAMTIPSTYALIPQLSESAQLPQQGSSILIQNNNFEHNQGEGINSAVEISADNNWWGDATGPTNASNPSGQGDAVNDIVDFTPFRTEAVDIGLVIEQPPAPGSITILNNQFEDNTAYGLQSSIVVNAENNWWGHPSGPYHGELNPDGTGNSVSNSVSFVPWLTATPDFLDDQTATPTHTRTPSPTSTQMSTNSPAPTETTTPSPTPTSTATATATPTHTGTPLPTSTQVPTNSPVPSETATSNPTPTSTGTPTHTGTPLPTSTQVPTNSPVLSETATPSPTPISTAISTRIAGQPSPTQVPIPDAFESNNNCNQAKTIQVGDVLQEHNFHIAGDVDWMQFNGIEGRTYRIEVQTQAGSSTDVNLELYPNCDGDVQIEWGETFTPGVRVDQVASADGPIFLRLENNDPNVAGNDVAYSLLVRDISPDTSSQGALIIMAGRLKENDRLQPNIHNVVDSVYRLFKDNGYSDDNIYYLATDDTLPGYDDAATAENLKQALVSWAVDKVSAERPLTLYMMDHGDIDNFYINEPAGERLNPDELNSWLDELESKVDGLKSNIIIEACNSGSFIEGTQRISDENRLVISSTNVENVAYASSEGAQFSDRFLMSLREGYGIQNSFWDARNSIRRHPNYLFQEPWIDADGDGIADTDKSKNNTAQHNPGVDRLPADTWAPYIVRVVGPESIKDDQGTIQAEVRDNKEVKRVWASVHAPSYTSPQNSRELIPEDVPIFALEREAGDLFSGVYDKFSERGVYNVTIYAEDNDGLKARLSVLEVNTVSDVVGTTQDRPQYYLPFVSK